MRARQWPTRRAVVKHRRRPRNRVVARGAVAHGERRSCGGVRRIIGLLPSRQVALRVAAIRRLNG